MKKHIILLLFLLSVSLYLVGLIWLPESILTFCAGLPVAFWISNLFHELGHFLSYTILGVRWTRFSVSYFSIEKETTTCRVSIDLDRNLYNAACSCVYDKTIPLSKYVIALLSGGVTCALLGAVCICLWLFSTGAYSSIAACFSAAFMINAAGNLLIPMSPDRVLLKAICQEKGK